MSFTFAEAIPVHDNKVSSWLVTIDSCSHFRGNWNEDENHILRAQKHVFNEFLKELFNNFSDFLMEYEVESKTKELLTWKRRSLDKNHIMNGKIENSIEIGGVNKSLHSHTLVTLEHPQNVCFKVNIPKLQNYCYAFFGKRVWIQIRFIKDHRVDLLNYITKIRREKEQLKRFNLKEKRTHKLKAT